LPNTAGCYSAEDAIRYARLARAAGFSDWLKLEIIGDQETLLPDTRATIEAARILVEEGFKVMAYTNDDLIAALRLEDAGCVAVMPLASPIGSGLGVVNPYYIREIKRRLEVPIIVDAGVGTASDACITMEQGVDGVLMNTAIAVADEMGLPEARIRTALSKFGGVKRRFTRTGESGGVTVIDDYGHHPVEIAAVLKAARQSAARKVIAVVQPHRFTRLRDLFEDFCTCFNDADQVIVAEVYPAGEAPLPGIDRDHLVEGLRARGHRNVVPLADADDLAATIAREALPGDLVVCLGAGNITAWANELPARLDALRASEGRLSTGGER